MFPLFLMLALMMMSRTQARLALSLHAGRAQHAQFAAESALARSIAQIRKRLDSTEAVAVDFSEQASSGRLHFDASQPHASVNNRTDAPVELPGSNPVRYVYPNQIHLVAVGRCGPVEVVKEVRLSQPAFPYVIYSSGRFHSSGGLLLGAVKPGVDIHAVADETDLLPAEMLANSSDASALVLEGTSTVVGSPKSVGGVTVGRDVRVLQGEARSGERAQDPPTVDIASYDPAGRAGLQTLSQATYSVREPMSGLVRFSGPKLTFSQGLELSGGMLFVDGDLEIGAGGIRGQGAVVCTGNVTILGGSDFASDSKSAVVAGGNVTLQGSGQDSAFYQGLLYSGGDEGLKVSRVTLLGAAVAGNPSGATVDVSNARVVFDREATRISEEIGFSGNVYPPRGFEVRGSGAGGGAGGFLRLKPINGQTPTPAQLVAAGAPPLTAGYFELVDASGNSVEGNVQTAFTQWSNSPGQGVDRMNTVLAGVQPDDPLLPGGKFNFDLNRFVKEADRLRMIWRN